METAAAAMLEAGVGRFSRAPAMAAALLAEMWAPLAVVLAALATLPSLLRRLQGIVLRLRSRGKEVIQARISTYYSSSEEDEGDDGDKSSSDEASSSGDEEEEERGAKRIGYFVEGADDGFPSGGGAVVRTWQGFDCCGGFSGLGEGSGLVAGFPAVRVWGAGTASGDPWWSADEGGCDGAAAEAEEEEEVVVGWRRDRMAAHRRRRRALQVRGNGGAARVWEARIGICLLASRWRCRLDPPASERHVEGDCDYGGR